MADDVEENPYPEESVKETAKEILRITESAAKRARDLLDTIEGAAIKALSPDEANRLVPGDKIPVELALKNLRPAFEALDKILDLWPVAGAIGHGALVTLMATTFEIGIRCHATASSKEFFRPIISREQQDQQVGRARAALVPANEQAKNELIEAITKVCAKQKVSMAAGAWFAESIHDDVCRCLSDRVKRLIQEDREEPESAPDIKVWEYFHKPEGWPSARTIERTINAALQDCGKS